MEAQQPVYTEQLLPTSSNQDFVAQPQQQQQPKFIHSTESSPNVLPVGQPEAFPFPTGNASSCQYDLQQQQQSQQSQQSQVKLEMMSQLTTPNDGQPLLQQHLLQATTNALSIQHNPLAASDVSVNSSQPLHQGLQQQQPQQMIKQEFGQTTAGTTAMHDLRQQPPPPPIQLPSHYQHGTSAGHAPMLTPLQTPGLSQGIISPQSHADLGNYPLHSLDQQQPQQTCIINAASHIDVPGETPTILGYVDKMDAMAMAHDPTSTMENPSMVSNYQVSRLFID